MKSEYMFKHRPPKPTKNTPKIIEVLWKLKQAGKADATIRNIAKCLNVLDRNCSIEHPDSILSFVATADKSQGYKRNLIMAYEHYVNRYNLTWEKPRYHEPAKMPKIPQESKIDQIIANSPKKLATALSISKDTGLRPVELMRTKLRDFDLENGIVYPSTAKNGSPRVLRIKNSTLNMLNKYIASRKIKPNEKIFGTWNSDTYGKWFRYYRNKTAEKLQDPALRTIRLYDLRHFFATMTYHRTKDILFVKQQMGHRKIDTTLVYTQLLQFEKDDNYSCKVAKNIDEAAELIENGFEYVTEMEGVKLFRKRK